MPEENKSGLNGGEVEHSSKTASSRQSPGNENLNDAVDEKGIPWKNRAMEFEKKANVMAEKLDATQSRIAQLEEQGRLTNAQLTELSKLKDSSSSLEDQIAQLEKMPEAKPYLTKAERIAEEKSKSVLRDYQIKQQTKVINRFAKENGMDSEAFINEIKVFASKYPESEYDPVDRAEMCYEDWKAQKEFQKEKEEFRKSREKEAAFSESSGRVQRGKTFEEVRKSGSVLDKIKALGKYEPPKA